MKTLKKSIALVAVLAFLLAAMLPAAALADDEDSPDASGGSDLYQLDQVYLPADASYETTADQGSAAAALTLVSSDADIPVENPYTVLTNANVEIELTAENSGLPTQEGYAFEWDYKWVRRFGTDAPVDLTASEETPNVYTVTRTDLAQTGSIYFECTATGTVTYTGEEGTEDTSLRPVVGTYRTVFCITTLGRDVTNDPRQIKTFFTAAATSAAEYVDGEMVLQLDDAEYDSSDINLGPTDVYVTAFHWSTDAPKETFDADGKRTIEPGLGGWGQDFDARANNVKLRISPNDLAAGNWNYYCEAEGVGITSQKNRVEFEVSTVAALLPFKRADYASDSVNVTYAQNPGGSGDDLRKMNLTFKAARGTDWTVEAYWAAGIAPVGAVYSWSRNGDVGTAAEYPNNRPTLPFTVNDATRFNLTVEYVPAPGIDPRWVLEKKSTDTWYQAVFDVKTEIIVEQPSIKSIELTKPNGTVVDATESCGAPRGGNIELRPVMANDGDLSDSFTYEWQVAAAGTQNFYTVTNSRSPVKLEYELEENGRLLRVKNVTDALQDVQLRVAVSNGSNLPVHKTTVVTVTAAEMPELSLESDPAASLPMFAQVKEKGTVKFTAIVKNAISEKNLAYQWEVSETGSNGGFAAVQGANKAEWTTPALTRRQNETLSRYYYRCKVSNTAESPAVSRYTAVFTVEVAPQVGQVIWVTPTEDIEYSGEKAYISGTGEQLTVQAQTDNGQRVSYQWQVRLGATRAEALVATPTLLTGETNATLQTGRMDAGWRVYSCIATNTSDESQAEESPRFIFEVLQSEVVPVVEILTDREVGAVIGSTVKMKVNAFTICGDPVTYEWQVMSGKNQWAAAPGGTRSTFTLTDVQAAQNGTQYRCRVYNREHKQYYYDTQPFTLSVWQEADVPKIIVQPKDVRLQNGTVGATTSSISTTIESQQDQNFVFTWQVWNEAGQYWDDNVQQEPEEFVGPESTEGVLHLTGVPSDEGMYRCVIENLGGSPAGAQAVTNEVNVRIMERHRPLILTQPAAKVYANVGKTTALRINADVEPVEELVYTWMISLDAGKTWRNVGSADGNVATYSENGVSGSTLTTKAARSSEVGTQTLYKCQVRGAQSGVMSESRVSSVIPKTPSPEIKPVNDTILNVTVNPRTGERFLTGEAAGSKADCLTPKLIRQHLDYSDAKDATIEVTRNGKVVGEDESCGTGCVVTLLDKKGVPLDEVELVIQGDLSGDGVANLSQLVKIASAFKGNLKLSGSYLAAADHNGNGKIDLSDLVKQAELLRKNNVRPPEPPAEEEGEEGGEETR